MTIDEKIERFLQAPVFAVAGASKKRHKYGNKVLRCYLQNDRRVIPVHPVEVEIEGLTCVASVLDLPEEVDSLSLITPPGVSEKIVEPAVARGIRNIWMQPGAESPAAVSYCEKQGVNVIADGSCLLVVLHYRER